MSPVKHVEDSASSIDRVPGNAQLPWPPPTDATFESDDDPALDIDDKRAEVLGKILELRDQQNR